MSGTLYLLATPIGNLDDITLRVLKLLESVDMIAAEDTRHTLKLLNHFNIKTPTSSYHEHNKHTKGEFLIEKLKEGFNIALVTDAGMPGISDPGADMVRMCYKEGIKVTVAPGAVACVTALVLSGLDTRRFIFEGFLPTNKSERKEIITSLVKETRTTIFYEAPHRLISTLKELGTVTISREIACVKEISKKFEQVKLDTAKNLIKYYEENTPRGEYVLVVEGASADKLREEEIIAFENITIDEHMKQYIKKGLTEKEAMKSVARDRGVSKREIYAYIHKEKE